VNPLPMLAMRLMLGSALYGVPPDDDDLAAMSARYEKCAGAATPECKRLQWRLEAALYGELRAIVGSSGERLPPDVLRAALAADTPQLKAFALQRMPSPVPADLLPLVLAAIDSEYAMVREPALNLLGNTDPKYRKYADGVTRAGARNARRAAPVRPDAAALGGPVYPGASYRPFASTDEAALFTSSDPQDKVIAFYAKPNRPAQTAAEVKAGMQKKAMAMQDPMAMMELMKKAQAEGKNPADVMMAKQKEMMGGGNIQAFEGKAGVTNPRYIALDDAGTRTVLVFKDDSLGGTSIVFFVTSPQAAAVMAGMGSRSSGSDPMQAVQLQQYVNKPLLESEK
jgi:hypothetical protein